MDLIHLQCRTRSDGTKPSPSTYYSLNTGLGRPAGIFSHFNNKEIQTALVSGSSPISGVRSNSPGYEPTRCFVVRLIIGLFFRPRPRELGVVGLLNA